MTLAETPRYDSGRVSAVGGRAVVLGGSVAGLCAARVLADGFEEVVIVERDAVPAEPAPRDGAPQTSHPHVLLEAGRATLEDLFPGFTEGVLAAGGLVVDAGTDMKEYNEGGVLARPPSRLPTYCASRALLEHEIRERVRDVEHVRFQDETRFTDYLTNATGATVTGVAVRAADGTERHIDADLVVDATGRTSRTGRWLEHNGYAAPPTDEVQVDVGYGTVHLERPADDRRLRLVSPSPPENRGAALIPVEGGRWELVVQAVHDEQAPADREAFTTFAESLPLPEIGDLVESQRWCSDVQQYPYPASRRRRYETLDVFPEGLVVTGDALTSFNPVYGQGMSVAALEAVHLHHALADGGRERLGPRFFDRAAELVDTVWRLVVGGDFAFPATTGPKPAGTDLANWYVRRLLRRAHTDPVVSEAFARVTRLERPPETLVRPGVVRRVLAPDRSGGSLRGVVARLADGVAR
ncbi:FAD-dependent oxidoreductase [Halorarius halobius]|uniref:FAD-dependent oxidoreductase n=1 Tax=Halorarius halobius TaxID=2962671 RepID=UPI0020CD8128|nr:FAD-dependent monooxygenase [Halorarius halobius]